MKRTEVNDTGESQEVAEMEQGTLHCLDAMHWGCKEVKAQVAEAEREGMVEWESQYSRWK